MGLLNKNKVRVQGMWATNRWVKKTQNVTVVWKWMEHVRNGNGNKKEKLKEIGKKSPSIVHNTAIYISSLF